MKQIIAYENAVDLLDADHKAVKKMFVDYDALCQDGAPANDRQALARQICTALTVHAQIEEELFYPAVRQAIGDDALMDEALAEHAEAKTAIAGIQAGDAGSDGFDEQVQSLAKIVDAHVLEEREQIFLKASVAALDLRGLVVPLVTRKKQLQAKATKPPKARPTAKPTKSTKTPKERA